MKLKDLKSGMAVHCQTEEQAKAYCRQLEIDCGFSFKRYGSGLCFLIDELSSGQLSHSMHSDLEFVQRCGYKVIEFTDLEFGTPTETEQENGEEVTQMLDTMKEREEIYEMLKKFLAKATGDSNATSTEVACIPEVAKLMMNYLVPSD